jgi:hypothetical protein
LGYTRQDLDAAAKKVEDTLADEQQLHGFLISCPEWIDILKDKSPQEWGAIEATINELCNEGHYEKANELRNQRRIQLSQKCLGAQSRAD